MELKNKNPFHKTYPFLLNAEMVFASCFNAT